MNLFLISYFYEAALLKEEVLTFFSGKSQKLHGDVLEGILSCLGEDGHHELERFMSLALTSTEEKQH